MKNRFGNRETLNFQVGRPSGANLPNNDISAQANPSYTAKPATYNSLIAPTGTFALKELGKAGNVLLSDGTQTLLNIGQATKDLGIIRS